MRSLFLKIFLSFLLTILLVSMVVVVLTYLRDREFPPLAHRDFARAAIGEYGREAIREYERKGLEELDKFIGDLRDKAGVVLILFNNQAQPISRNMIPRRMHHMAKRALRSGEVVFPMMGSNALAGLVRGPSGRTYVVGVVIPERRSQSKIFKEITHGLFGWRLLVLLFVSAVACYFWRAL